MRIVSREANETRMMILEELNQNNRTAISLIMQGYSSSAVHRQLTALIKQKLVFRHGENRFAYYSTSPHASECMVDPIIIPEVMASNFQLAFRMGYTTVVPKQGRIYRGDKA